MENDAPWKFYCPRCGKPAAVHQTLGGREYTAEALRTPYFLCGECRLIFISKKIVRKTVSEWWHGNKLRRFAKLKYFYDGAIEYLYGCVLDYHKKIGYKPTRFKSK